MQFTHIEKPKKGGARAGSGRKADGRTVAATVRLTPEERKRYGTLSPHGFQRGCREAMQVAWERLNKSP
jgi:hypothetical protein